MKADILSPLIVNLATAAILFVVALLARDRIVALFRKPVERYPLYCVCEPYNDADGRIVADLFVINLRGTTQTERSLQDFLSLAPDTPRSSDIRIGWNYESFEIVSVTPDEAFNAGKGSVQLEVETPKRWRLRIQEIHGKAILKFTIRTDMRRETRRDSPGSAYLEIAYPGD